MSEGQTILYFEGSILFSDRWDQHSDQMRQALLDEWGRLRVGEILRIADMPIARVVHHSANSTRCGLVIDFAPEIELGRYHGRIDAEGDEEGNQREGVELTNLIHLPRVRREDDPEGQ